jgi:hypothetical protein
LYTHHTELSAANESPSGLEYLLNLAAEARNTEGLASGADEHIVILHVAIPSAQCWNTNTRTASDTFQDTFCINKTDSQIDFPTHVFLLLTLLLVIHIAIKGLIITVVIANTNIGLT